MRPRGDISQAELDLSNKMRLLWEQHVAWTRMTIISMVEGLADVDLVTKRLLRNPEDFKNALIPYYGVEKASMFAKLLTEHLVIAAQLVDAALHHNSEEVAILEKKWYANADEIAEYLNSINPYWSEEEFREMLHVHLMLTECEAIARIDREFAKDIALYDRIELQALEMSDAMTSGIVRQFPNRF
mgnify:FL=1